MRRLLVCGVTCLVQGCFSGNSVLTTRGIIADGWAQPAEVSNPPAVYCYSTIGQRNCYPTPQPEQEGRLVGFYAPPATQEMPEITHEPLAPEPSKSTPLRLSTKR